MRIITECLVALIIACLSVGCTDDFLERAPSADLTEEQVFADIRLTRRYHNGLYGTLRSGWDIYPEVGAGKVWGMCLISCADDHCLTGETWFSTNELVVGKWTSRKEGEDWGAALECIEMWKYCYASIRKINIFLANYKNVPVNSQNEKDELEVLAAEAKFLRAHHFFELVKRWGGVPIVDRPMATDENLRLPRSSYKECIDFIAKDCKEAAGLLPERVSDYWAGKATKGAALALRAKALLFAASPYWSGETGVSWQTAADACREVIDLGVYSLYPDYREQFFQPFNSEVIWCKNDGSIPYWNFEGHVLYGFGGWGVGSLLPTQEMVDCYEMAVTGKMIYEPGSGYDPEKPYEGRDPRFYASILYNGAQWQGKTVELYRGGRNVSGDQAKISTGYFFIKHLNEGVNVINKTGSQTSNWNFIRYADVLLMYAEALNQAQGPVENALWAVNQVRRRAGLSDLTASLGKEGLNERIINERAVELCVEDQRWFDIRRLGMAEKLGNDVHKATITKNTDGTFNYDYTQSVGPQRAKYPNKHQYYLYPIFIEELNRNPNLTQNPGWPDINRN